MDVELFNALKDGGDLLTYLLVYVAYKQHQNSQIIADHERGLVAAGL